LDVADVHVVDGTVIVEAISIPVPALIAGADVAESIVNAAVVTDVPAPESIVVAVSATGNSPVARRPQITRLGRPRPCARYPVIALRRIAPISGRPQIAIAGTFRLRIFRQLWGSVGRFERRLPVA
jgi:hypothetical protein